MIDIRFPYIVDGEVVFIPLDQLPPQGTGIHITYGPYLHR